MLAEVARAIRYGPIGSLALMQADKIIGVRNRQTVSFTMTAERVPDKRTVAIKRATGVLHHDMMIFANHSKNPALSREAVIPMVAKRSKIVS